MISVINTTKKQEANLNSVDLRKRLEDADKKASESVTKKLEHKNLKLTEAEHQLHCKFISREYKDYKNKCSSLFSPLLFWQRDSCKKEKKALHYRFDQCIAIDRKKTDLEHAYSYARKVYPWLGIDVDITHENESQTMEKQKAFLQCEKMRLEAQSKFNQCESLYSKTLDEARRFIFFGPYTRNWFKCSKNAISISDSFHKCQVDAWKQYGKK